MAVKGNGSGDNGSGSNGNKGNGSDNNESHKIKLHRPAFCPIGQNVRMSSESFGRTCSKFKTSAHAVSPGTPVLAKQACQSCPIGQQMLAGKRAKDVVEGVDWFSDEEVQAIHSQIGQQIIAPALLSKIKENKRKWRTTELIEQKKQQDVYAELIDSPSKAATTFVKKRQEAFMAKLDDVKRMLRSVCKGITIEQRKELAMVCLDVVAFGEKSSKDTSKEASKELSPLKGKKKQKTQKNQKSARGSTRSTARSTASASGSKSKSKRESISKPEQESKRKGITTKSGNVSYRRDPAVIKQVLALRDKGKDHSSIAFATQISKTTVSRIISDAKKRIPVPA